MMIFLFLRSMPTAPQILCPFLIFLCFLCPSTSADLNNFVINILSSNLIFSPETCSIPTRIFYLSVHTPKKHVLLYWIPDHNASDTLEPGPRYDRAPLCSC